MPNWVTTNLTFRSKNEKEQEMMKNVHELFCDEEDGKEVVTFSKLIPEPEHYEKEDGWYEWRCMNWGTKWNACDSIIDGNFISFNTAWALALPVLMELSKRLGEDSVIEIYFADDNIGFNAGHLCLCNGEEVEYGDEPNCVCNTGSEEDERFSCRVLGIDYDEFCNDEDEDEQ